MDKIEIFGFLLINILMWAIACVDPRGVQHFAPALIIGVSGPIVILLLAKYLRTKENEHNHQLVYEPQKENELIDWNMDLDFSKEIREMEDFLMDEIYETDAMDYRKFDIQRLDWQDRSKKFCRRIRRLRKRGGDSYKDHHRKEGIKRKEMFACWNM